MFNKQKNSDLNATQGTLQPGDFELGSPQSRAAARIRLERLKSAQQKNGLDIIVRTIGKTMFTQRHYLGRWKNCDGQMLRISYLPSGLSADAADRIVNQYGEGSLAQQWNKKGGK